MITIFNRRELITVPSQKKFFCLREALSIAGIPSYTKTRGLGGAADRRARGVAPPAMQDYALTYTIYVYKDDYDRAARAIQPALRNG